MARMTTKEREDFAAYCRQATDRQVHGIIEKERAASQGGDEYRKECYRIALAEKERRGL